MKHLQALLEGVSNELAGTIAAKDAQLFADYPVATYIRYFDDVPADASYSNIPAPVDKIYESIKARGGEDIVQNYNKIVLTEFMRQYYSRVEQRNLTPRVERYFLEYYRLLVDRIKNPRTSYFRLSNSAFEKDLAVCRMKLWPCGAELVDEKAGFSRSLLLTHGVRQAAKGWSIFLRAKGFAPFFETHFDRRFVQDFSPEGYQRLYQTIAELLEVNQHVKGVIGGSWWHDPALQKISPDIWFLTKFR